VVLRGLSRCAKVILAMREHYFTLEEANALVPWLEETFAQLAYLQEELADRQNDLSALIRLRSGNGSGGKEREIAEAQRRVESMTRQLQREVSQVTDRAIIVRDVGRGLVDFPSYREGQEIYLCWIRGEVQIEYWHGTNEGFASRRRL